MHALVLGYYYYFFRVSIWSSFTGFLCRFSVHRFQVGIYYASRFAILLLNYYYDYFYYLTNKKRVCYICTHGFSFDYAELF